MKPFILMLCILLSYSSKVDNRRIKNKNKNKSETKAPLVTYYKYYYTQLETKLKESLSINQCNYTNITPMLNTRKIQKNTQHKKDFLYDIQNIEKIVKENNFYHDRRSSSSSDIYIREIKPPTMVTSIWGTFLNENICEYKVYLRTTSELYKSNYFQKSVRLHLNSNGCGARVIKKDLNGKFISATKRIGMTLHPDHPRCHYTDTIKAAQNSVNHPYEVLRSNRELHRYPFLIHAKDVIISRSGMIVSPCGVVGLFAQCDGVNWGVTEAGKVPLMSKKQREICLNQLVISTKAAKCPYRIYKKVFIMTQYDDTQIGQFHLEALPKLIFHLDYLYRNPDVHIHYGFSKRSELPAWVLPNNYLLALNLSHRLINGTVMAEEIFMPREGGCQEPSYNAWELLHQREYFFNQLLLQNRILPYVIYATINDSKYTWKLYEQINRNSGSSSSSSSSVQAIQTGHHSQHTQLHSHKRTILIIKRSVSKFVQNFNNANIRFWPKTALEDLTRNLTVMFKHHQIVVFSDRNSSLMTCPICQVEMFARADVVIGIHGAGLANTLYMKKGSFVVEVVPKLIDSRHLPVVGIFSRLSAIVGLHHYVYYLPDHRHYDMQKMVRDIYANIQDVIMSN